MPKSDHEKAEIRRATEARRQLAKDRTSHDRARGVKKGGAGSRSDTLTRRELETDEFEEAIREIHSSSDRVAAIMGAALIEHNLILAIGASLKNNRDAKALFHESGAPFGTFKAKIIAGHALGLFNARVAKDLDRIRIIRNQFAHSLLSFDFTNALISKECMKMGEYTWHIEPERKVSEPRMRFENACWTIAFVLLLKADAKTADRHISLEEILAESLQHMLKTPISNAEIAALLKDRFKEG